MSHIPKQSHGAKSPAFEVLCNSLCGPLTKKFVDPCFRGFEQLSRSSGWRVIARNVAAVIVAGTGVKSRPCYGVSVRSSWE